VPWSSSQMEIQGNKICIEDYLNEPYKITEGLIKIVNNP